MNVLFLLFIYWNCSNCSLSIFSLRRDMWEILCISWHLCSVLLQRQEGSTFTFRESSGAIFECELKILWPFLSQSSDVFWTLNTYAISRLPWTFGNEEHSNRSLVTSSGSGTLEFPVREETGDVGSVTGLGFS